MAATGTMRRMAVPDGYRFAATVGQLGLGRHDPSARFVGDTYWWAVRTPDGPASLALSQQDRQLFATGYGPGGQWVLDRADAVAGLRDDLTGFPALAAAHPLVARLARTHRGVRLPATGRLFPLLLRAICEQKVTVQEAYRAYAAIVRHFRDPAPGPVEQLLLPPGPAAVAATPGPAAVAATPYWTFHPLGLEQRRAETLRRAAASAARLELCGDAVEATARMTAVPGIGPWTAAEVVRTGYGDPDAVSVGDYHIPNTVAWALAGEPRGDDHRMLQLLAPFAGHRGRVCVLLAAGGIAAPRFGPRRQLRSFARF